ncbi:hypothetical protein [Cupriavidus basilensis]|nr:hypothetical protein [Cupriavidus basilensis]MCP3024628.1 hypothetical protein [Cupriavidus basilensis]
MSHIIRHADDLCVRQATRAAHTACGAMRAAAGFLCYRRRFIPSQAPTS